MQFKKLLDLIGNTPLIESVNLVQNKNVKLLLNLMFGLSYFEPIINHKTQFACTVQVAIEWVSCPAFKIMNQKIW